MGDTPIDLAYPAAEDLLLRVAIGACRFRARPGGGDAWIAGTYHDPTDKRPTRIVEEGASVTITEEEPSFGRISAVFGGVPRVNPPAKPLPPPPRLSLICGDAIQNLRVALDYLVWQLVLLEGNRPGGWTNFPITTHINDFNSRVRAPKDPKKRPSPLQGITVGGEAWTLIEEAQPYNGGELFKDPTHHELFILAFLSNTDKHRTLMSQVVFPGPARLDELVSVNPPDVGIAEYRVANQPLSLVEKTELVRVRFSEPGPDPQVRVKRKLPVQPSFGDMTTQIPLRTIKHIRGYVRRLIDGFDRFF